MLKWKFYRVDMRFKFKTYTLLLFASIILFVIGCFINNDIFFINIHADYYVIAQNQFYWMLSVFLLFLHSLYLILIKLKVFTFNFIGKLHVYGTILLIITFIYVCYKNSMIEKEQNIEALLNQTDYNSYAIINLLILLLLQFLFIINIFVSIIKRLLRASQ